MDTCICIAESLCLSPETITTSAIPQYKIKSKKKKKKEKRILPRGKKRGRYLLLSLKGNFLGNLEAN